MSMRNGMIAAVGFGLLMLPSAAFAGFRPSAALQSACRGRCIQAVQRFAHKHV